MSSTISEREIKAIFVPDWSDGNQAVDAILHAAGWVRYPSVTPDVGIIAGPPTAPDGPFRILELAGGHLQSVSMTAQFDNEERYDGDESTVLDEQDAELGQVLLYLTEQTSAPPTPAEPEDDEEFGRWVWETEDHDILVVSDFDGILVTITRVDAPAQTDAEADQTR